MILSTKSNPLLQLANIGKLVTRKNLRTSILNNVALVLYAGQSCSIQGESGAGKSTLLNILGLLDLPSSGDFYFREQNLMSLSADQLARIRNTDIGFVFQSFNLLPALSALDNVALPLLYRGIKRPEARQLAGEQLAQLGLMTFAHRYPADLSGGQQQRVAVARALVGRPSLILADEPTGNLDKKSATLVMDLLLSLNQTYGTTLAVVTHDPALAARFDRKLFVQDGHVTEPG